MHALVASLYKNVQIISNQVHTPQSDNWSNTLYKGKGNYLELEKVKEQMKDNFKPSNKDDIDYLIVEFLKNEELSK